MRTKLLLFALGLALSTSCSSGDGGDAIDGGSESPDAQVGDGGGSGFAIQVLDEAAAGRHPIAVATKGERVGIAYFAETGGSPSLELRYVEPGASPEVVAQVDIEQGAAVAFDGEEPMVAFLGGGADETLFWKQSDLALARRSGGTWTSEVLVRTSADVASGIETSDFGLVVGHWPAMAVQEDGEVFIAYRDVHGGQFPTDYQHADVEVVEGRPGAWRLSMGVLGGDSEFGHGARMTVALANGVPALAWAAQPGGLTDSPRDIWFARRLEDGTWQEKLLEPTGDTRVGPVLSWSATSGFGIAYEDLATGVLSFLSSKDGATWGEPVPIFGEGSGGWYPSVAFAPDGEPTIAFYLCSFESAASSCKAEDDALVLKRRRRGLWPTIETTVDPGGAWYPRLAFAGDKAVVAYKDPETKVLKLAVER